MKSKTEEKAPPVWPFPTYKGKPYKPAKKPMQAPPALPEAPFLKGSTMLGNLGLHIIQYPTKLWGFVGSVPVDLCTEHPAQVSDILGCRTHTGPDGKPWVYKTPVFDTEEEARAFAASKGHEVQK